jgi:hypothetical protein
MIKYPRIFLVIWDIPCFMVLSVWYNSLTWSLEDLIFTLAFLLTVWRKYYLTMIYAYVVYEKK